MEFIKKSKVEQIEQKDLGNTRTKSKAKQTIQTKNMCYTLNNWSLEQKSKLLEFSKDCEKYVHGEEVGECGTPHLQGSFILKKKARFSEIKSILGINEIHIEKMKGTWTQCFNYCIKDGCNLVIKDDDYEDPPECLNKEDFYPWQKMLYKLLQTKANDRTINWVWDTKGNIGKTAFTRYLGIKERACIIQKGKYADIMNHVFNTKNMKIFIVDVPRSSGNNVSYNAIESIKSGIIFNSKYETGQKFINPPHIVVFANYPPDKSKLSADRWNVINLNVRNTGTDISDIESVAESLLDDDEL